MSGAEAAENSGGGSEEEEQLGGSSEEEQQKRKEKESDKAPEEEATLPLPAASEAGSQAGGPPVPHLVTSRSTGTVTSRVRRASRAAQTDSADVRVCMDGHVALEVRLDDARELAVGGEKIKAERPARKLVAQLSDASTTASVLPEVAAGHGGDAAPGGLRAAERAGLAAAGDAALEKPAAPEAEEPSAASSGADEAASVERSGSDGSCNGGDEVKDIELESLTEGLAIACNHACNGTRSFDGLLHLVTECATRFICATCDADIGYTRPKIERINRRDMLAAGMKRSPKRIKVCQSVFKPLVEHWIAEALEARASLSDRVLHSRSRDVTGDIAFS